MPSWTAQGARWLRQYAGVILVAAAVLALDRATKVFAQLVLTTKTIVVFPFLHLHYVENTGAAFGMMQGGNWLLIFVMLGIIAYILWNWKDLCAQGSWTQWGCVLIVAGAFGNLYDRIVLGHVVDFLDFLVWPVFNVADSAICVGAGCFIVSLIVTWKQKREAK